MNKFLHYLIEVVGWLKIMLSPLLLGALIASFIYFPEPSTIRLVLSIFILILGLILGIVLATKVWKNKGTNNYLSEIMASHDLDDFNTPSQNNDGENSK